MKTPTKTDAKAALALLDQAWAYFDIPQKAEPVQQPDETYFEYVKAA